MAIDSYVLLIQINTDSHKAATEDEVAVSQESTVPLTQPDVQSLQPQPDHKVAMPGKIVQVQSLANVDTNKVLNLIRLF